MRIATWNIRGCNKSLKLKGLPNFIRKHNLDFLGVIETKLKLPMLDCLMRNYLPRWNQVNNFDIIRGGRILILWNPSKFDLNVISMSPQNVHCKIVCRETHVSFFVTVVYGLHTVVKRRGLWESLLQIGESQLEPWLILGDFNSIKAPEEKIRGAVVTAYEMKDFQDTCLALGLSEVQSSGCFFTWNNNEVWSKIDRALVNPVWHANALLCSAEALPPGCLSDHSPIVVSVLKHSALGKKTFKFFNMWASHPDFLPLVSDVWGTTVYGTSQFTLCQKLKFLKGELKSLDNLHFSHITSRVRAVTTELEQNQLLLDQDPSDSVLRENVKALRAKASFLSEAERSFLSQKAKCDFLTKSDKNTKFFHSIVKRNRGRNYISSIIGRNGVTTTTSEQVASEFEGFYFDLFGVESHRISTDPSVFSCGPRLSDCDVANLIRPILPSEVKHAIFDIGDDKAPGPDGFSSGFFKKSWSVVGSHVTEAVLEFFQNGRVLKQLNHTIISLVPKTTHSVSVADFRPIACCNVIYKAITKIISDRLAPILPSLVDKAQAAFVSGRSMTDNIFLSQELLRGYTRKRSSPRCTIKVDLQKAYDTVSWSFLREVLVGLGFPPIFVGWVMQCVSTPTFSIALNGSLTGFFAGKRGLRQGDPMSPSLFILCMEYFSRLLNSRTENTDFNYHPKCADLRITHLAFADDLMLFARGDLPSIHILVNCLDTFKATSGLGINASKSNIFTAGLYGRDLDDILELLDYPQGSFPVRYLGVPLAAQKLNVVHYAPLLDRITSYISSWTANTLSYAGRMELIRSVLQGVECFWLQIFPLPNVVIKRIIKLCRAFLWSGKRPLVGWKAICLPKDEGGLGIRDAKSWNNALLSRILWNLHLKTDSLWIKWVHHIYLRNDSVWVWNPHTRDSPLLKRIAGIRDHLCTMYRGSHATIDLLSRLSSPKGLDTGAVFDRLRRTGVKTPWKSMIWKGFIPPKFSFIVWLALWNRLQTRDNLPYLDVEKVCPLCKSEPESSLHLFFNCRYTYAIWDEIRSWLGISRSMTTIHSAIKWLKKEPGVGVVMVRARLLALMCTIYQVWKVRNAAVFDSTTFNRDAVVKKIKSMVYSALYSLYPVDFVTF